MKKPISILATFIVLTMVGSVVALPDRIGDFALLDSEGEFHQLSRYRHREALVLMAFDNSCSSIGSSLAQLAQLQSEFKDKQVAFALINSLNEVGIESFKEIKINLGADFALLLDSGQLVSETIAFSKAGEIAILDPDRLTLLYRGGIDLATSEILKQVLAG